MNGKIAMLIGEKFPGKRVDFLMRQTINLFKTKPDSKVIVLNDKENVKDGLEEIKKYKVLENTFFFKISGGKMKRILSLPLILNHPIIFFKSLSSEYYPMNFTLKHYLTYNYVKKLPFKIDTLHCHFGQIGIIGSFLKENKLCKKLIISFYGGDLTGYVNTYGKDIYKRTFESADYLVACTDFLKEKLIDLGCDSRKIILSYLPQDPGFFKPFKKRKKGNKIRILTVARLVKEKGIQNAIKAISILSKKYNNLKYIIVGSGGYREHLEKLVNKYSLQGVVEFTGIKAGKEALKEYQNADIFVLPSISTHNGWVEGGGLVNLEAQLCELPVVASNCGGIPEYVLDGVTGYLAEENPEDLVKKLSILVENPSLRKKMGKEGRKRVKKIYSKENLNKLTALYK